MSELTKSSESVSFSIDRCDLSREALGGLSCYSSLGCLLK